MIYFDRVEVVNILDREKGTYIIYMHMEQLLVRVLQSLAVIRITIHYTLFFPASIFPLMDI